MSIEPNNEDTDDVLVFDTRDDPSLSKILARFRLIMCALLRDWCKC